jgi:hypothetical protein
MSWTRRDGLTEAFGWEYLPDFVQGHPETHSGSYFQPVPERPTRNRPESQEADSGHPGMYITNLTLTSHLIHSDGDYSRGSLYGQDVPTSTIEDASQSGSG